MIRKKVQTFLRTMKNKYGGNSLFLFIVCFIYIGTGLYNKNYFLQVGQNIINIFLHQIIWVLLIIFLLMFLLNLFLKKEYFEKKLKTTTNKNKYIFALLGGILSTGPIYMRYPLLKTLQKHGLHEGHIASFMYARSVKIPFLAVMIMYFGIRYTIIFNIILILLSLIIGMLVHLFFQSSQTGKQKSLQAS